jgi:protein TonB
MENNINYAAMSLDDIIFQGRNKAYGAYDLRRSYNENVKRAIIGTIFFAAFAISYQNIFARLHHTPLPIEVQTIVTLDNVMEIKPPAPLEQKKQMAAEQKKGVANAATAALAEKKPVADAQAAVDTIAPIDPTLAIADIAAAGIKDVDAGTEKGTGIIDIHVASLSAKESEPVNWAEIMPEYPGGENALMNFLRNHLNYPLYEKENDIQGKAIVSFVIDEKGRVNDVKVVRGVSRGIDNESLRVIRLLPNFTPGMQSGHTVKVRYVIPLDFHLSAD